MVIFSFTQSNQNALPRILALTRAQDEKVLFWKTKLARFLTFHLYNIIFFFVIVFTFISDFVFLKIQSFFQYANFLDTRNIVANSCTDVCWYRVAKTLHCSGKHIGH